MATTVTYKGNTIATITNQTKTLTTAGKWMEADVIITDSGSTGTGAISITDTIDSHGGTIRTINAIDISDTDAVAADVASGKYFYTAAGVKTAGIATSGGGNNNTQKITGTFTGDGTITASISCSFAPYLINIHSDLSNDVTLRGIVNESIIKDTSIIIISDGSQSNTDVSVQYASYNVTDYTANISEPHATYSNGTLTINNVNNTATMRFASGITYSYEIIGYEALTLTTKSITANGSYSASSDGVDGYSAVTVNVSGGGGNLTSHNIYFEFSDSTTATIPLNYDNSLINTMITSYTPRTYNNKTVTLAQLDGVTWYNPMNIPLNTQLVDFNNIVNGYIVSASTGAEEANEWAFSTTYIMIDPTMTFSYIGYEWFNLCFYDSSYNFISAIYMHDDADNITNDYASGTLTPAKIPSNAMYIRISSYPTGQASSSNVSLIRTA